MSAAGPKGDAGRADRLAHALFYAQLGLKVFPVRVRVVENERGEQEKKLFPVLDWPHVATSDPEKVKQWWGEGCSWATASIGVATSQSGISVVDLDGADGLAEWRQICDTYGLSEDVPRYRTPGGGEHWWYRTDPDRPLPTDSRTVGEHIDTRGGWGSGGHGLVIVPPSTDERGGYEWIIGPDEVPTPDVPEAVHALIEDRRGHRAPATSTGVGTEPGDGSRVFTRAQAQAFIRPAVDALKVATRGERNTKLNIAARTVAHFGGEFWSREQAQARLTELAREIGLGDQEIADTIDSAYKAQAQAYASGAIDDYGRPVGWSATYAEPSPLGDDEGAVDAPPIAEQVRAAKVAEALDRLEVAAEAKRLFNAKFQPRASAPAPMSLTELLALPDEPIRYRVDGLLGVGGRILLAAAQKAGKTTLMGNLVRCLLDGGEFLGRHLVEPVKGRVVLLDTELPTRTLKDWLARQGIANQDGLEIFSLRDRVTSFNLTDPAILAEWVQILTPLEPGFVVLDCLRPVLDGAGLDESKEAGRFLVPFGELLGRIGVQEACLVQHMGHTGERARGDSGLLGWADANWKIVRKDSEDDHSTRFFSAFGRDVDVPECELGWNSMTNELRAIGGNRADSAARAALPVVLEVITGSEQGKLSGRQVESELAESDFGRTVIREALKLGIREGRIAVEDGPRGSRLHSVRRGGF